MDRLRSHTVHRLITATTLCCITHTAQCRYTWHSASLHDTATLRTDSSLLRHCAASHTHGTRHCVITRGTVPVYTTQPRCAPTHHCYDTVLHHTRGTVPLHRALCRFTRNTVLHHTQTALCCTIDAAQCRYTRHSVSDRTQPHCAVCTDSLAWL